MIRFFVVLLALALAGTPAFAGPGKGKGKGQGNKGQGTEQSQSSSPVPDPTGLGGIFSDAAQTTIRDYYHANPEGLQSLPPGIAKNLQRGKPLPPGIAKKGIAEDLQGQLPEFPGYELVLAGDNVLMVDLASQLVTDILFNVLN